MDLLWRTLFVAALVALLCAGACSWLLRRRVIAQEECGFAALVSLGLAGFASFFIWLLAPRAGSMFTVVLFVAAAWQLVKSSKLSPQVTAVIARNVLWPLGLTFAAALIVLSSGFWFGGFANPLATEATRFSHPLPGDNAIPLIFAENVAHRHAAQPILGSWQSSDRPPLQTGICLLLRVFLRGDKNYSVLASFLQSLWIFAAWLLLGVLGMPRRLTWLILITVFFSGFVFVNTFFVWPKLLAAAFSLAAYAALWMSRRKAIWVGLLAALAMLSHGGAVFFLAPLFILLLLKAERKRLALAVASAALLYLPWSLYQRFYDPSGDRLLKWHVGGHEAPARESFLKVLNDSYRRAGWNGALINKEQNLVAVFGKEGDLVSATTAWSARASTFFYFLPCLGLLAIGALALPINLLVKKFSLARGINHSWALMISSLLTWCLVMFGPGTTFVHQGPYATVLLAMILCVESLWTLHRGLALIVCIGQVGFNLLLYAPALRTSPDGNPVPIGAFRPDMFLLSLAAVGGFAWLLTAMPARSHPAVSQSAP